MGGFKRDVVLADMWLSLIEEVTARCNDPEGSSCSSILVEGANWFLFQPGLVCFLWKMEGCCIQHHQLQTVGACFPTKVLAVISHNCRPIYCPPIGDPIFGQCVQNQHKAMFATDFHGYSDALEEQIEICLEEDHKALSFKIIILSLLSFCWRYLVQSL